MIFEPENWKSSKRILVILAHPDDPDFFCGATLSRWCKQGHELHYCLLTKGQKGAQDPKVDAAELGATRVQEQEKAARTLGVKTVEFLDYIDGEVTPDIEMRRKIVKVIRKWQPDILLTSDPLNYFPTDTCINHPDHRAAGQAVIDAAFPAAGSPMFFPEQITHDGLAAHNVDEVWMSATASGNFSLEVSEYFPDKLRAIHCHRSQISLPLAEFDEMMKTRFTTDAAGKSVYIEHFRRIVFK